MLRPGHRTLVAVCALAACFAASNALADCTCRANGQDFALGASTCLPTPSGARLATCDMVLNNTSWRFTSSPCPAARAIPPEVFAETAASRRHAAATEHARRAP